MSPTASNASSSASSRRPCISIFRRFSSTRSISALAEKLVDHRLPADILGRVLLEDDGLVAGNKHVLGRLPDRLQHSPGVLPAEGTVDRIPFLGVRVVPGRHV